MRPSSYYMGRNGQRWKADGLPPSSGRAEGYSYEESPNPTPLRQTRLHDDAFRQTSGDMLRFGEELFYANEVEAEIENFCPSVVRSRSLTSEPLSVESSHANCYILGIFE